MKKSANIIALLSAYTGAIEHSEKALHAIGEAIVKMAYLKPAGSDNAIHGLLKAIRPEHVPAMRRYLAKCGVVADKDGKGFAGTVAGVESKRQARAFKAMSGPVLDDYATAELEQAKVARATKSAEAKAAAEARKEAREKAAKAAPSVQVAKPAKNRASIVWHDGTTAQLSEAEAEEVAKLLTQLRLARTARVAA